MARCGGPGRLIPSPCGAGNTARPYAVDGYGFSEGVPHSLHAPPCRALHVGAVLRRDAVPPQIRAGA